jgi:RNA polymerase sigma-70 factor, ECF subfamily
VEPGRSDRFEALARESLEPLRRYLARRTDAETAADVLGDTLLVAWRRFDDVPAEPLPWLYGVARKVLANHRRGAERRSALADRARAHATPFAPDPADAVGLRADLVRALAGLSETDRELVRLVAWEGLSVAEAADVLGCRRGTAAVRLHRARKRLRAALSDAPALALLTAVEDR